MDIAAIVMTNHDADADEVALDHLLEATKLVRPNDLRILVLEAARELLERAVAVLTEQHCERQVGALGVGVHQVAQRRVELRLANGVAIHARKSFEIAVDRVDQNLRLRRIGEAGKVFLQRRCGGQDAHRLQSALHQRLPPARRDVLVGGGVQRAGEHALGDAVE